MNPSAPDESKIDRRPETPAASENPARVAPAATHAADDAAHPDPITGAPGAHPVGVGLGAISAGAAGAAIGSVGGPVGMLIGAAIGAVAGGLAGKEVAATEESGNAGHAAGSSVADEAPSPEPIQQAPENASRDASVNDAYAPAPARERLGNYTVERPVAEPAVESISEAAIRNAAYFRYLDRQALGRPGDDLADWIAAEEQARRPR